VAVEQYADLGRLRRLDAAADQQRGLLVVADCRHDVLSVEAGMDLGLTLASDDLTFKLISSRDVW
jgi:hypothetical protein